MRPDSNDLLNQDEQSKILASAYKLKKLQRINLLQNYQDKIQKMKKHEGSLSI